jgi:hypothetical protein
LLFPIQLIRLIINRFVAVKQLDKTAADLPHSAGSTEKGYFGKKFQPRHISGAHPVNRLKQAQEALTASVFRQRCVRNVLQLPAKKI